MTPRTLHPPQGTEQLVAALLAMQVRFMLVGGLGVQHYCPERVAADLEVLIESSETNATGVAYALDKIGFTMLPETVRLLFAPGPRPQQIQLHPTIPADILTEGEDFDFMAHWEQSERANLLATPVRVASPQLLITMKSRSTREKDAQDVLLLQSYLETKAAR
ncbi:hypothetical protein [Hydrogenophaga sp.]|uniref:hypothetical protein n=1 Tax=Hydrogenophaga sp. TaxID=1904254 RepID=UPI0025C2E93B|nr:hypothetical protein [Hydrogenophaga sp.]MBT9465887.1 hypothetical protein [Hydrogenophaga sp.]